MEVRDPVHGSIHILNQTIPILRDKFFQRLRNIKQLGFSEYVFPGATHTRFLHSIGVMEVGGRAFDKLFKNQKHLGKDYDRLKESLKLACLLHDIGHAPLSHATESVMPKLGELNLPKLYTQNENLERQASHEDYTLKSIVDSSFRESFKEMQQSFGVIPEMIADLIRGTCSDPGYFTVNGVNYFSLLHQLVSSEMDCDRMDYLLRDSYFCGVSYGNYDLDWLLDNLSICNIQGNARLGISERAVVTFDDFLLSRYHMFVMVYFHYRSVCLEQLLMRYFSSKDCEYSIPSDIDQYLEHDDHYLLKVMRGSPNRYAKAVVQNHIPDKIFESFNDDQLNQLESLEAFLKAEDIEFIRCSSSGRLSKYYSEEDHNSRYAIQVVRKQQDPLKTSFFDISKATDLFTKFSKSHAINRLHVDLDAMNPKQRDQLISKIQSFA